MIQCTLVECIPRTLLLEGDDDERHEDVDEEEGKDDEEDDVIETQLDSEVRKRTEVLVAGIHRPLEDPVTFQHVH